jgi:hypothetical protein
MVFPILITQEFHAQDKFRFSRNAKHIIPSHSFKTKKKFRINYSAMNTPSYANRLLTFFS